MKNIKLSFIEIFIIGLTIAISVFISSKLYFLSQEIETKYLLELGNDWWIRKSFFYPLLEITSFSLRIFFCVFAPYFLAKSLHQLFFKKGKFRNILISIVFFGLIPLMNVPIFTFLFIFVMIILSVPFIGILLYLAFELISHLYYSFPNSKLDKKIKESKLYKSIKKSKFIMKLYNYTLKIVFWFIFICIALLYFYITIVLPMIE